jgi:hypothetical protein
MSYASLGTAVLAQRHAQRVGCDRIVAEGGASGAYAGGPVRIGWVSPTVIYDEMRAIDAAAKELDGLVMAHVARQVFRDAWAAWYARWRAFFEKYRPDSQWWGTMAKLGAATYTDELWGQVQGYRSDLERFRAGYVQEKTLKGEPVPSPVTPIPIEPPRPPEPPQGKEPRPWWLPEIPWWGWGLGIVVVGGVTYSFYRTAKGVSAKKIAFEREVLPKVIGAGPAKAATAGDPGLDGMAQLERGPIMSTTDHQTSSDGI